MRPLVGPGEGPSDAAVIRPRLDSPRGIAIGCGLAPQLADGDPYWMAVAAIDEALRNVICVGGDPSRTAILDNFCWPRVDDARNLGAMVRACQACYDVAKAYGLPFISGKDSLNNEFALDAGDIDAVRTAMKLLNPIRDGRIAIPYTLLISAVSLVNDVANCVTMDLKRDGSYLCVIGRRGREGTYAFDTHQVVANLIRGGIALAVHDISGGGVLTAIAEMCIAGNRSACVFDYFEDLFVEPHSAYVVEVSAYYRKDLERVCGDVPIRFVGEVINDDGLPGKSIVYENFENRTRHEVLIHELRKAWQGSLDW